MEEFRRLTRLPAYVFNITSELKAAARKRGEDVIIAHHDTTVQPDDHLILFLTDRRHIEAVEKLFQGSASFL